MKAKFILPVICAAGAIWLSLGFAEDKQYQKSAEIQSERLALQKNMLLTEVLNTQVKDASGQILGQIKDIILDPATGRARFAVIEVSADTKTYTPVPWTLLDASAFSRDPASRQYVLKVDRSKFDASHKLNTWPDYEVQVWGPRVYTHYGLSYAPVGAGYADVEVEFETGSDVRRDWDKYGPVRPDGRPIDNGTAPDGKGTFFKGIRP